MGGIVNFYSLLIFMECSSKAFSGYFKLSSQLFFLVENKVCLVMISAKERRTEGLNPVMFRWQCNCDIDHESSKYTTYIKQGCEGNTNKLFIAI